VTSAAYEDDVNINGQRLLRKTEIVDLTGGELVWALQCEHNGCGHVYGASAEDFDSCRCPKCDGGKAGA
jgi:hypothetical protein